MKLHLQTTQQNQSVLIGGKKKRGTSLKHICFSLPQACEWLLQCAKVSLYHHQLGIPTTKTNYKQVN